MAWFLGLLSLNQTPLPQAASSLPFLRQLPSVYTVSGSVAWPCSRRGLLSLYAGSRFLFVLSPSTRKHSSRECREVIVGSNVISSPFSTFALLFFSSRLWVRVRSSFLGWSRMLYLSSVNPVMSLAKVTHWWGFLQPSVWSCLHPEHSQFGVGVCHPSTLLSLRLIHIKSLM